MLWTPISEKGLKNHLDQTKQMHNNYGYDDFVRLIQREEDEGEFSKSKIANLFNISRVTLDKWIEIHDAEVAKQIDKL